MAADPTPQRATLTFETSNRLTDADIDQIESLLADFADWRGVQVVRQARSLTVHHLTIHPVDEAEYIRHIGLEGVPVECDRCGEGIFLDEARGVWTDEDGFEKSEECPQGHHAEVYTGRSIVAHIEVWDDGAELAFPVRALGEFGDLAEAHGDESLVDQFITVAHGLIRGGGSTTVVDNYEVVFSSEVQS